MYYKKTIEKFEKRKNIEDEHKEQINNLFNSFIKQYHDNNFEFLYNKAKSLFGDVDTAVIDDCLQDIYLSMFLIEEEKLLQMDEIQLLKVFRSIVGGVQVVGNLYKNLKYTQFEDIDNYNY